MTGRLLYDEKGAAEQLSTTPRRVAELRRAGELVAVKDGGNTLRKARTWLAMIAETFSLWPMHSTTGPARHSSGERRRK